MRIALLTYRGNMFCGGQGIYAAYLAREWKRAGQIGLLRRTDQQFHWCNNGYDSFDDFTVAQARAGVDRILYVQIETVPGIQHGRDPALGEVRVGVVRLSLRDELDGAALGEVQRERETGDPGADDEKITVFHGRAPK